MASNRRITVAVRRSGRERQAVYDNLDENSILGLAKLGIDRRGLRSIVSQANQALENERGGAASSHVYSTRSKERRTAYQLDREDLALFADHRNRVDEDEEEEEDIEEEEEDESLPKHSRKVLSAKAMSRRSARINGRPSSPYCRETMYERVKTRPRQSRLVTPSPETEPTPTRQTRSSIQRPSTVLVIPDADESNQSYADVKREEENKSSEDDEEEEEKSSDDDEPKQYLLRQHRNPVARFEIRLPEPRNRPHATNSSIRTAPIESTTRTLRSRRHIESVAFRSPAHKSTRRTPVRKHLERRSSSTSSCASEVDRDDEKFERRKQKSLNHARRRFLPMNIDSGDLRNGVIKDRMRAQTGASCSDIDPMAIDRSIGFDQIGGLVHHLQSLKEMVLFPLLYHDIFDKFKMAPPRGVVFYGPPGTGKTLVARALANECSRGDKKISFFMRRGADVLSKWVGESERQLRLLFDQAYTMRPSIIFFDEIDGLAPVRSSRQDQIHSSIVSTLLALMDGLDGRGEVIIIGATNRLDSLDPALRRPGRFDRELKFSLPDRSARRSILSIHTSSWGEDSQLSADLLDWLVDQTSGYCGADLKELCTEAVLIALRREYPQIYLSNDKYQLDANAVRVQRIDFVDAIRKIVPANRRDMRVVSRPLAQRTRPLLITLIEQIMRERIPSGYVVGSSHSITQRSELSDVLSTLKPSPVIPATRLLLCGRNSDYGQTSHIAPALIHSMDHLTVFSLSIANIYAASSHRSPEEAVAEMLQAATRSATAHSPLSGGACIVFIPAIDIWLSVVPSSVWHTLVSAVESWDGYTSILLLATSHHVYDNSPSEIRSLFHRSQSIEIGVPTALERCAYFRQMLLEDTCIEPAREPVMTKLPLAAVEPVRKLNDWEMNQLKKQETSLLREMRIFLREMLGRLIRDRRFNIFAKPVDPDDAPDYFNIIANPMDLSSMMDKIDQHRYDSVSAFLDDINLIMNNALEYNPNRDLTGKLIRHRASALKDSADALIDAELDWDFEKRLLELRKLREPNAVAEIEPPARNVSPVSSNSINSYAQTNTIKTSISRKRRGRPQAKYRRSKRRRVCIVGQRTSAAIVKKYRFKRTRTTTSTTGSNTRQPQLDDEAMLDVVEESTPAPEEHEETEDSHDSAKLPTTPDVSSSVLLIDRTELEQLVDDVVRKTHGWSIGELERLASKLHAVLDTFGNCWDRRTMPTQLRDVVDKFSLTN